MDVGVGLPKEEMSADEVKASLAKTVEGQEDTTVEVEVKQAYNVEVEDLPADATEEEILASVLANCGACDVLCERILGAEGVGAAHMAAWPRLDEPEIGANRRVIVDPDEAFVPPRSVEEEVKGLARPMTRSERRRIEAEAAQPEPEPSAPPPPVELMALCPR